MIILTYNVTKRLERADVMNVQTLLAPWRLLATAYTAGILVALAHSGAKAAALAWKSLKYLAALLTPKAWLAALPIGVRGAGKRGHYFAFLTKGADLRGWGKPVSATGGSKRFMTPLLAPLYYTTFGIRTPYLALGQIDDSPEATIFADTERPGRVKGDARAPRRLAGTSSFTLESTS